MCSAWREGRAEGRESRAARHAVCSEVDVDDLGVFEFSVASGLKEFQHVGRQHTAREAIVVGETTSSDRHGLAAEEELQYWRRRNPVNASSVHISP